MAASWGPSPSASPFADCVAFCIAVRCCVAALLRFSTADFWLLISGKSGQAALHFIDEFLERRGITTPRRDLEFPLETRAKHAAQRYFA